jgi:hypothetical protein
MAFPSHDLTTAALPLTRPLLILQLHQRLPTRRPTMNITNSLHLLRCLPPQLMPQHAVNPHLRLRSPLARQLQGHLKHFLRRRNDIHDPVRERLLACPAVRFEDHFPRDLWPQFEAWEGANAVKVQAEVYWWLYMAYQLTEQLY